MKKNYRMWSRHSDSFNPRWFWCKIYIYWPHFINVHENSLKQILFDVLKREHKMRTLKWCSGGIFKKINSASISHYKYTHPWHCYIISAVSCPVNPWVSLYVLCKCERVFAACRNINRVGWCHMSLCVLFICFINELSALISGIPEAIRTESPKC